MVASRQVCSADGCSEKGVSGKEKPGSRQMKTDAAAGMAGSMDDPYFLAFESGLRFGKVLDGRHYRRQGVVRAAIELEVVRMKIDTVHSEMPGKFRDRADVVDMGVCQQDCFTAHPGGLRGRGNSFRLRSRINYVKSIVCGALEQNTVYL